MKKTDNFDRGAPRWSTTQERNREALQGWCDLAIGLQVVRGQWKASILIALSETSCGIPELQKRLAPVNRRVLARALRELEAEGLIAPVVKQGFTYALSDDGASLVPILRDVAAWQQRRGSNTARVSPRP